MPARLVPWDSVGASSHSSLFPSVATRDSSRASSIQCSATFSYALLMDGSVACAARFLASSAFRRQASLSDDMRGGSSPASIELLSAQSSASSHGGKTRCRRRDARPMLGDYAWSCGSWSLYSTTGNIPMALSEAIIATYMTIHMARPPVHTVGELRLLARSSGRERKSCGCGFQATKACVCWTPKPKSSRRSQRAPGASGARDWN